MNVGDVDRWLVIGVTGAGKSTLADAMSDTLRAPAVHLDDLYWEPGWREGDFSVVVHRIAAATCGNRWIVDGSYRRFWNIYLERVQGVVFIDYPFWRIMKQLTLRTLRRVRTGEPCCNGNRERLLEHLGRDSLFLWAIKTFRAKRQQALDLERSGRLFVRLRSPQDRDAFLADLAAQAPK